MRRVLLVLLLLAACAPPEVVTEPDAAAAEDTAEEVEEVATTEPADPTPEATAAPEPSDVDAAIGDTITLQGLNETRVAVTVVELIDPATPEFTFGDDDGRYLAVRLDFENVGDAVYDDAPGNMVQVIDGANQQHSTTFEDVEECHGFQGSVRLAPGDVRSGCVVFEFEGDVQLVEVTLDSGFGPQTGRWRP